MPVPDQPEVKFEGVVPQTLREYCTRNAIRIQELSAAKGYSSDCESGFAYDAFLRPGWRMSDDYCHTIIEPTVAAMLSQLRRIVPCDCDDCKQAILLQSKKGVLFPSW